MAHHQYTNDPERDPDLLNLGRGKRAFEFPMTRARFIAVVYFCMFVAPMRFVEFQLAYIAVNTFGKGRSIYMGTDREAILDLDLSPAAGRRLWASSTSLAFYAWVRYLVDRRAGRSGSCPSGLLGIAVAGGGRRWSCLTGCCLPSPFRQAYSTPIRRPAEDRLLHWLC